MMQFTYKSIKLIVLISWATLNMPTWHPQSQSQLPNDIIFSATNGEEDESRGQGALKYNFLGRVDADTLDTRWFYEDRTASALIPLSWSPDENLLAVLRVVAIDSRASDINLCIITALGEQQTCSSDRVVDWSSNRLWSVDSQRAYFVTEDISGNNAIRYLVEMDVVTGETLQTLYQVEYEQSEHWPPAMGWSSDLSYVMVGVGSWDRIRQVGPARLVNINSGEELILDTIEGRENIVICREFSSLETYMVALEDKSYNDSSVLDSLIVLDTEGIVVQIVDLSSYDDISNYGCPTWSKDEKTFFFYLSSGAAQYILSYSLQGDELAEHILFSSMDDPLEAAFYVIPPLRLSPGETFIAFSSYTVQKGGMEVTVVDLNNNEVQHFSAPFHGARNPIWAPKTRNE
jgi:hypothetical protein